MKTIITFKALRCREIVYKNIPISFKGAIGGANMILKIMKEGNKQLRELTKKEIELWKQN